MGTHEQYLDQRRQQAEYEEQEHQRAVLDAVADALCRAFENGHEFEGWSAEAIADDMLECGGIEPERFSRADIIKAVTSLRK